MSRGDAPLLEIKDLYKEFVISGSFLDEISFENWRLTRKRESVKAINGVSLDIRQGEALCLVGESGCGKTTVGRVVMSLLDPTRGSIVYDGQRIDRISRAKLLPYHRRMQMIFQNPYASLNPRKTVRYTLLEPVEYHYPSLSRRERNDKVREVMESVGISPNWADRYPHEFSGGQRQRISIARALTVDPEFIVADEPISALDVSIQAQVLNLLTDAARERGLTYLFITHDLSVVKHFGSRVAVMYLGTVCEVGRTSKLFSQPRHPYTQALLSAIPSIGERHMEQIKLHGEVPTPINLPSGCVFHGRCPHAMDVCRREIPEMVSVDDDQKVACHAVAQGKI